MDVYLTAKDVARVMKVTTRTVRNWVRLGRLRPVRMGGTIRFKERELHRSIEKYEYGDPDPPHDPSMG